MTPELLASPRIDAYVEHLRRHIAANGAPGELVYDPYEPGRATDPAGRKDEILAQWAKAPTQVGWGRVWAVCDGGRIVGHVGLKHQSLATDLHRALLGMGIEASHRRRGLGKALLKAALQWAESQPSLDWVHLGVFAHNEPARRLYEGHGFKEIGRTVDAFRVGGQSIDDVQMALRLRRG